MSRAAWLDHEVDFLRANYEKAGMTVAALCQVLGRTPRQVAAKANALGLHQHAGNRRSANTQRAYAWLLAVAQGPIGASTTEASGIDAETLGTVAGHLVRRGQLHRAKLGHRTVRYFADAAAAARYEAANAARNPGRAMPPPAGTKAPRAWWPADAEPRITAETKVTIAPAPAQVLRTNTHSPL